MRRPLLFVVLLSLILIACSPVARPGDLTVLTIATADSGGTMYPVGSAIASILSVDNRKVNVSASTGSNMNVDWLLRGETDLALVSGDTAYDASQTPKGESLRAIAAVYLSVSNWIAPVNRNLLYVHDLAGCRLGIGPQNSATDQTARIALSALHLDQGNTTLLNCGLGAGADLVLEDQLDAIHGFTGAPIGGLANLAESTPCRVLLYTPEELDAILAANHLYEDTLVAAGTYKGQTLAVRTFGVRCLLCADASMDEDLAFSLTEALWNQRETLARAHPSMEPMANGSFLHEDLPIPLHPGASRFYDSLPETAS